MDKVTDEVLSITRELMAYETTEDRPEEIAATMDYIAEYVDGAGVQVERYESDGMPSLLIHTGDADRPEILLHGHVDVVEGDDSLFEPTVEDGKLYGRGAADMKSGLAALLYVMRHADTERDIALAVTADEETGGMDGMRHLVEDIGIRPAFGISAEPSTRDDHYMEIITRQKGLIILDAYTTGKSIHTSKPWKGESAAEHLVDRYQEIRSLFPEPSPQERTWAPTLSLSQLHAHAETGLPEEGEMRLNIWTNEEYTNQEILADIRRIDGLEIAVEFNEPMLDTAPDNTYVQQLQDAAAAVADDIPVTKKAAASDMRFLSKQGIPAVVFGPEGYNAHSSKEYAVIDSFADYVAVIRQFLEHRNG